jgi:hypothetical protein
MATARSQRPRYYEGQYIGAADLMAAVDYSRELSREAALSGQTWGICLGLDLAETPNAAGGTDYFVLPGLAFDGYGRPIVVLTPAPVPASLFAGLPSGNQQVWLRYDEDETRGLRPGWQSCDGGDAYSRVRESYAIEVGPLTNLDERQSGIELAGATVADARLALREIVPEAPLLPDGSVPHQTFPPDSARWLVPVGSANWVIGAPGKLDKRTPAAAKLSRTLRRYAGQVAESLVAADGVLRLRDRMIDFDDTKTVDDQCAAASVTTDDLVNAPDPKDSTKTLDRLVGKELVWVEGNLRVTGDARLWGTKLELRAAMGADNGVPLYLTRSAKANLGGGQDMEIALGSAADGKSRLVAGVAVAGLPLQTKMELRNDGRLAVGNTLPADVKAATILAYTPADTTLAIGAAPKKLGKLQFTVGAALSEAAHVAYDDDKKHLRVLVGTDLANASYFTVTGHVGIRMADPISANVDANDLVVYNPTGNVGITLLSDANRTGNLHFADGLNGAAENRAGFIRYDHATDKLQLGTADAVRATIDAQGRAGFGTTSPTARIDVREPSSNRTLQLDGGRIQSTDGGSPNRLELQAGGGGLIIGSGLPAANRAVISTSGFLGIGTEAPVSPIHIRADDPEITLDMGAGNHQARIEFARFGGVVSTITYDGSTQQTWITNGGAKAINVSQEKVGINLNGDAPTCSLHVRSSFVGPSSQASSHTALIENTAQAGDVLALRVGSPGAATQNNYITFFDNTGAIGRIEQGSLGSYSGNGTIDPTSNGTFLRLISGGADFAEALPRGEAVGAIGPGRIVGVRGGQISLVTEGAEALMVTTDRAVVVGNAPAPSEEARSEHVAMMGQVPVFVEGPVRAGDYIVPSGRCDGNGHAVAPEALAPGDLCRVVGRAWADGQGEGCRRVLVAIGVAGATAADAGAQLIAAQAQRMAALEARLDALGSA